MAYRIAQDHEYLGNKLWRWRTWIDAPDDELGAVEKVTWYLHHTFDPSVVIVDDRADKFALERRGWGVFQIRAEVKTAHDTLSLSDWLQLRYPEGEEAPHRRAPVKAARSAARVFLSYGAEDDGLANRVKSALETRGYQVLSANQAAPGVPFDAAARKMIRESDVVMGIVSSDYTSPFVIDELGAAARSDKPTIALLDRGVSQPQGLGEVANRIELDFASGQAENEAADILEKFRPMVEE